MSREHSISLHLAKVMGLEGAHLHTYPSVRDGEVLQDVFIAEEIGKKRFYPFTNRAQWADVVLWYVSTGNDFHFYTDGASSFDYDDGCLVDHANNAADRIGASLEIIALATGWAP